MFDTTIRVFQYFQVLRLLKSDLVFQSFSWPRGFSMGPVYMDQRAWTAHHCWWDISLCWTGLLSRGLVYCCATRPRESDHDNITIVPQL